MAVLAALVVVEGVVVVVLPELADVPAVAAAVVGVVLGVVLAVLLVELDRLACCPITPTRPPSATVAMRPTAIVEP